MKTGTQVDLRHREKVPRMNRAKLEIEAVGIDFSPCFNDCYVTFYVINDEMELRIIDWEYGANNNPYWDLAWYLFQ